MNGEHSLLEISKQITTEFEVEEDQAQQDLLELIAQLESIGAVSKV